MRVERGHRPSAGARSPSTTGGGAGNAISPAGVWTRTRRSCGWREKSATEFTRAKAMPAASSRAQSASVPWRAKPSRMIASMRARLATRWTLVEKAGSLARPGSSSTSAQKRCHSRSFWIEISTGVPSALGNGS